MRSPAAAPRQRSSKGPCPLEQGAFTARGVHCTTPSACAAEVGAITSTPSSLLENAVFARNEPFLGGADVAESQPGAIQLANVAGTWRRKPARATVAGRTGRQMLGAPGSADEHWHFDLGWASPCNKPSNVVFSGQRGRHRAASSPEQTDPADQRGSHPPTAAAPTPDGNRHVAVMPDELIAAVVTELDGFYVDATFGRGGHARRLLAKLSGGAKLLVVDRDEQAVAAARQLVAEDDRVSVADGAFGGLADLVRANRTQAPVGIYFDVGVSSPQLADAARGFSFLLDGPLDMRMDQRTPETAADWLNRAAEPELARVLRDYGEERFARRTARHLVEARPITSTGQLAALVQAAIPARNRSRLHPATRVFQAIRIHLNDELGELSRGLEDAFELLPPGGRLATITFHSLEHRVVRRRFRHWVQGEDAPGGALRKLPLRPETAPRARLVEGIGRGLRPSAAEIAANPRSRSALLQAVEKAK